MSERRHGRPLTVWILVASLVFLGLRGIAGGSQFVLDPSGSVIGLSTEVLAGTPLSDFLLPGVVLLTVFGIVPLFVAERLWRGGRTALLATVAIALALLALVSVEALVLGFGRRLQIPNLLQAVVMLLLASSGSVRTFVDDRASSRR